MGRRAYEALLAAMSTVTDPPKSCGVDGCRHHAGYLDSGDNEWCACHYWGDGNPRASECEGQPAPVPDRRERMADAILAAGFRRTVQGEPTHDGHEFCDPRLGCVQGEPSDAQVRAALDAYRPWLTASGSRGYPYREVDMRNMRAALRAAAEQGGKR